MADTKTTKTRAKPDPDNLFNKPLPDWLDKMLNEIIAAETTDSTPSGDDEQEAEPPAE